ncbi:MAG: DUF4159 domain-containing protein [Acidobacteria bacterium]|nr:DUF4159 domain-containing protein [Acidobacteriota bacterium]
MHHPRFVAASALTVLLGAFAAYGQIWSGGDMWRGGRNAPPRYATETISDGEFHFCRLLYQSVYREAGGSGWRTDYPGADINFSVRLAELTKTAVSRNGEGDPEHFVVRSRDDENLFRCPFVHMEDVGTVGFNDADVVQLREYLLKGGFIWGDDFWGDPAWKNWESQIGRVLPPGRFPIVDIPVTHTMFQTVYSVKRILQVPAISQWRWSGGRTSERGLQSAQVNTRGIFDEKGRLIVLMTHNTDISDTWEREGEDPEYFYRFSPEGYAIAINVMMYVMTH